MYSSSLRAEVNLTLVCDQALVLGDCYAYLTLPSYARVSQELPPGVDEGSGREEKERLDTAPQNSVATTPPTHNCIVIILLLIKNHENICRILAATEHEFSVVSIAETWKGGQTLLAQNFASTPQTKKSIIILLSFLHLPLLSSWETLFLSLSPIPLRKQLQQQQRLIHHYSLERNSSSAPETTLDAVKKAAIVLALKCRI